MNPNGGGLLSQYGKWNSERWLRSFYVQDLLTNQLRPAPFSKQFYAKRSFNAAKTNNSSPTPLETDNNSLSDPNSASSTPEVEPPRRKRIKRLVAPPLMSSNQPDYNESDYDRTDGQEQLLATTDNDFLSRIPLVDPYLKERRLSISGGTNIRYFTLYYLNEPPQGMKKLQSWLMAVDYGVAIRPFTEHVRIALEGRYLNNPKNSALEQGFTTEHRVRSAYALIDDLPLNSYVMVGLYRPMLGLHNPDHDSLSNLLSGVRQRAIYKAVGIGAAPNVPFFNVNYIMPFESSQYDQSRGFAANLGARWVTLGASLVLSYWNLATKDGLGTTLSRQLVALTTGLSFDSYLIWNTETLFIKRENSPGSFDGGTVFTNQLKFRFWRENYLQVNFALSNTDNALNEGAANELGVGFRSFLFSGTDVELLYVRRNNETPTNSTTSSEIQAQLHLFL